jgi:hypothetical protein
MAPQWDDFSAPLFDVSITDDPADCVSHMPILTLLSTRQRLCAPTPGFGYHLGPGGVAPQKYLIWDELACSWAQEHLNKGYLCLTWEQVAYAYGASGPGRSWTWTVEDTHGPTFEYHNPTQFTHRVHPIQPDACAGPGDIRWFHVYLDVVTDAGRFHKRVGNTSGPCADFRPVGPTVNLEVDFSLLALTEVDDGSGGEIVEVYGDFQVYSDLDPRLGSQAIEYDGKTWYRVGWLTIHYTYDAYQGGDPWSGPPAHTLDLQDGTYFIRDFPLAEYSADGRTALRSRAPGNNQVVIPVHEGETLLLWVGLLDDDGTYGSPDRVCLTQAKAGPFSLVDLVEEDSIYRTPSMPREGNAACALTIVMKPLPD